ncbi:MAG: tyrosine-type recombinase/integrase [Pseudomonadota bacterium]
MARKTISGLTLRGGVWHVNKVVKGQRIYESTGTGSREEAERYLIHRLEGIRQATVYGVCQVRTWREAATKYLLEFQHQPSIWLTALYLEQLDPFIGELPLTHIDDDALRPFIVFKKKDTVTKNGMKKPGAANRTVNIALQRVVRVLNLCARKWRDENKHPWLNTVPMITMLDEKKDRRQPYPLSWDEQTIFFRELPDHLRIMALFKVNAGCREQEVCKLRWEWEIDVPELGTSVFLIPAEFGGRTEKSGVKNREERLVVLNDIAKSIIEGQRGRDDEWVFPYEGHALHRMNDSAWRSARTKASKKWQEEYGKQPHPDLERVRVHDLKHTFGRRLRAAGVTEEDRQVLLGHKNGSVTTHYSSAELTNLITAANKVVSTDSRSPTLTILKRKAA